MNNKHQITQEGSQTQFDPYVRSVFYFSSVWYERILTYAILSQVIFVVILLLLQCIITALWWYCVQFLPVLEPVKK